MASRLILRIQERSSRLTSSERKIAQVLLQNQGLVETHTATELAARAGVSKATTARFFRSLGYADFEEVRLQAREERNRREPYSDLESISQPATFGRTISDHLELELRNLTRTFEELRSDLLPEIAQILETAPRIWFVNESNVVRGTSGYEALSGCGSPCMKSGTCRSDVDGTAVTAGLGSFSFHALLLERPKTAVTAVTAAAH